MTKKQENCLERQKKRIGEENLEKIIDEMGITDLNNISNKRFNRLYQKIVTSYPKPLRYKNTQDFELYHANLIGIDLK